MIIVENDKEDEEKTIRYLFAMPQGRVSIMCCFFQYIGKYVLLLLMHESTIAKFDLFHKGYSGFSSTFLSRLQSLL